jgi:hypothetical protein
MNQVYQFTAPLKKKSNAPTESYKIRGSAVGIETGYGLDDRGVGIQVPVGAKNFHFSIPSRQTLRPYEPILPWG